MPQRPPRQCHHPGCPNLVTDGGSYCREHLRSKWREQNIHRPSAAAQGYGARWRKLREQVLREEPYCRLCGAPASEVDHIVPRRRGGTDARSNLQPLCKSCHSSKTMRELNQRRRGGRGEKSLGSGSVEERGPAQILAAAESIRGVER